MTKATATKAPATKAPALTITTDVARAYRSLSQSGITPLQHATVIIEYANEFSASYADVCKAADRSISGDGRIPASVYHKINSANILLSAGVDVHSLKVTKATDKLAQTVNRVILGRFAGKTKREDVEPKVVDVLRETVSQSGNVTEWLKALSDLENSLKATPAKNGTDTTAETVSTVDSDDTPASTSPADNQGPASTISGHLEHVRLILADPTKSSALSAKQLKTIKQQLVHLATLIK